MKAAAMIGLVHLTAFLGGCGQSEDSTDPVSMNSSKHPDTNATLLASVEYAGDAAGLPDAAKVFVFIREPGSRMPLAVEQFAPSDLPVQVGFSAPDKSVKSIEAVARLSLTGAVTKHGDDPEVVSEAVSTDDYGRKLRLLIPQSMVAPMQPGSAVALRFAVNIPPQVHVAPTARLFVIARMKDAVNPMPVAVKAYGVGEFPPEVILTDGDSMTSVARLSRNKQVEVTARLSQAGTTGKHSGDWESPPQLIDTHFDGLTELELSREID